MSIAQEFLTANQAQLPFSFIDFRQPNGRRGRSQSDYFIVEYAAKLICSTLQTSGFERRDQFDDVTLIVGSSLGEEGESKLKPGQRVNHFTKTFSLGSKEGYHVLMSALAKTIGDKPSFYPESYVLPRERKELQEAFEKSDVWIQKPTGGARGAGISLLKEFPVLKPGRRMLIQKYIKNPLLINGLKFDLRFYVAVPSLDPFRIYLFDNGLVRLAAQPYEDNLENIELLTAHLTNYSINREDEAFKQTDDLEQDGQGNKWSHRPFWPFLESQEGFDVPAIRRKIEDAIVQILIAAHKTFKEQPNHRLAFELFGFDVMIDQEQNVSVLEVNVTPALGTASALDMAIKAPLVADLFNLVMIPKRTELGKKADAAMISPETDPKVKSFIGALEFEAAEARKGGFQRIFPTPEKVAAFGELMTAKTPADDALAEWIGMDDEKKGTFLQEGLDAWKNYLSPPPPPPAEPEAPAEPA
jgi:hypothetical protein